MNVVKAKRHATNTTRIWGVASNSIAINAGAWCNLLTCTFFFGYRGVSYRDEATSRAGEWVLAKFVTRVTSTFSTDSEPGYRGWFKDSGMGPILSCLEKQLVLC
jgi:hypothetical protein